MTSLTPARRPRLLSSAPASILSMMLVVATLAGVAVQAPTAASANPMPLGTETAIGPAFTEKILSPDATHGVGVDGRSLTYFVTSGNTEMGALFQAVDTLTGKVVFKQRVSAGVDSWAMTVTGNTVVFTVNDNEAHLYSWKPGQAQITSLGAAFDGDSVWSMTTAPDGTVYAGSFPTGRVWKVDLAGNATAISTPNPGEAYVRALAADSQYVYAGSLGSGKFARVNRATNVSTAITLPTPPTGNNNNITDIELRGQYLMITVPSAPALYVYDTKSSTFVKTVEVDGSGNRLAASPIISRVNSVTSPVDPSGKFVYFQRANFGLAKLDLTTFEYSRTGYSTQASPRDMFWVNTGLTDWANPSLAVAGADGTLWAYDTSVLNLSSRPGRQIDLKPQLVGSPGEIRSLGAGPDGKVYAGGFLNPTGVRVYNPSTNSFSEIAGLPQVESFGTTGSKVLMGGYPRAGLITYDTSSTASYKGVKDDFAANPSLHEMGNSQERPFDFEDLGDGTVAVATVSQKSTSGGSFTVWKPDSATKRVYRNPILNQSVVSLEKTNGVVVAGSSINGGTGFTATETKAKLFTVDPATGKVISSVVPSPEGRVPWVNGLSVDPADQTIWGIAGRVLFHAEVGRDGSINILKQEMIFENNPGFYGNDFSTFVRDGVVYATSDGNLYAINPITFEKTTLATGGITDLAVVGNRDLYYSKNNLDLYRYRLPTQSSVVAPVLGSHTQADVYNPGSTVFSGTGTVGSEIKLTVAGTTVSTTVNAEGKWTAPAVQVPAGDHQVALVASLNGVTSSTVTTTVQFSAPISTPTLTSHLEGKEYGAGPVTFKGTGTKFSTVTLTVAGKTVTTPVYSSGQWFVSNMQVPVGNQTVTVSATKDGYTTGKTSTSVNFVNGITLPELTTPAVGAAAPAGTVTLVGTADPFSKVTVTAGGKTVTVPTYSSGMWFVKGVTMPSGNQAILMTSELNGMSSSTVRTVRYFSATTLARPTLTSPSPSASTPVGMVSFYGTATKGSVVKVTVDGVSVTAPPTYSSGMWFAPPIQVGAGTKTITMTSTLNGQSSTSSTTRVFASAVKAPELTNPAAGSTTPAGTYTLYGNADKFSTVTVTAGGKTVSVPTYSSGIWFAKGMTIPAGEQTITMTATLNGDTSPTVTAVRDFS